MENKVFTKTNLILSAITIVLFMIKFFELLYLDNSAGENYVFGDIALGILIFLIYTIIFAYLSRLVGIKKGIEEGRKKGRQETLKETAKKMKEEGLDIELIEKITNLTKEEILTL